MSGVVTPFDAFATAAEVVNGLDLTGKRVVVTGGASGIGLETARALASAGAEVTLAVRDLDAGRRAAADLPGDTPVRQLDLADLASVDSFVAAWDGPLDVLVANAGVMHTPKARTVQGWELQLATNHLGHMALTLGLHEALKAPDDGARVVVVSSASHTSAPVDFDDLMFDRKPYDREEAYAQSKTANVLFAVELDRRWAPDGIRANALMPGGIFTALQRHWTEQQIQEVVDAVQAGQFPLTPKTAEQGAATSVMLAVWPGVAGVGGRYFEDLREAERTDEAGYAGVRDWALDPETARRLWDVSVDLLDAPH